MRSFLLALSLLVSKFATSQTKIQPYLNLPDYENLIKLKCFMGQNTEREVPLTPLPVSTGTNLETLLSMIERLEERRPEFPPEAVARYFLKR